jgi:glycosyltransferase involved in cell wall biosynthesis
VHIGFYGNTNNYPLMLARAVRKLGHQVTFVLDHAERLHRPEGRYPELRRYPEWIHDLSPVEYGHYVTPSPVRAKAVSLLRGCDAVILNALGPSLLHLVQRPAIALLTGSDLEVATQPPRLGLSALRHPFQWWILARLAALQRQGIRRAKAVSSFYRGFSARGDEVLDALGVKDETRFYAVMTDLDLIPESPLPANEVLRIFCVARLNWKLPLRPGLVPLDYKGTDIMIRGVARFVRTGARRVELHLVRKGWDVAATVQLVEEEGLKDVVVWHEEMSQEEVLAQFRMSDIVFDSFSEAPVVGMGALDAMATGRPLISNGRAFLEHRSGEPSPLCHAATAEEVCAHLERLAGSREERQRVGAASRSYVARWCSSERAARDCLERLSAPA